MNKLFIIGNLTKDPELRTTQTGINVCSFTVAVNRRTKDQETDYFRVTAWRGLADTCAKYLVKGRKVAVVGSVKVSTYTGQDGQTRANLDVLADEVEFLTSMREHSEAMVENATAAMTATAATTATQQQVGFTEVQMDDSDLPF